MEYKLTHQAFYEALKQDKLLGLKCNECGAYTTPPKKVCLDCASEDIDVVELKGIGEIKSFTTIYVAPEGAKPPYSVALVELDEGPWVMGNMAGIDPDKADMDLIGRKVKIGHKIVPADKFSAGETVAITFSLMG